jgi:hypothetical protein
MGTGVLRLDRLTGRATGSLLIVMVSVLFSSGPSVLRGRNGSALADERSLDAGRVRARLRVRGKHASDTGPDEILKNP